MSNSEAHVFDIVMPHNISAMEYPHPPTMIMLAFCTLLLILTITLKDSFHIRKLIDLKSLKIKPHEHFQALKQIDQHSSLG